jgi:hypothetical protein
MDRVHEFLDRAGVADGRGASELSLAAAPGHGSLPRGWQRERARRSATGGPLTGARVTARRRRTGDEASTPSSHGAGTIEEGRRRGEVVWCSTGVRVPFYRVRRGAGGREWRAAAVIGAFMAAIIGVKGGELWSIEEGGVKGGDRCSSMARKKGGVHGAAAAREEAAALPAH